MAAKPPTTKALLRLFVRYEIYGTGSLEPVARRNTIKGVKRYLVAHPGKRLWFVDRLDTEVKQLAAMAKAGRHG